LGLFSLLAKLIFLVFIIFLSYVAVSTGVGMVSVESGALDQARMPTSTFGVFSSDALLVAVAACVGVFFTIPLCLALVGHAGDWLKHVASRSAKYLFSAPLFCRLLSGW
jgi:hypothetical protein